MIPLDLSGLAEFPAKDLRALPVHKDMRRAGLLLRAAGQGDLVFLRALFADIRAPEMAMADWPEQLKRSFLDSQFVLQHQSYVGAFPQGIFMVAEAGGQPVGRLTVDFSGPRALLVDIAILSPARRRGYGRALLKATQKTARASGCTELALHVDPQNVAARALYLTQGFIDLGEEAGRRLMVWRSDG